MIAQQERIAAASERLVQSLMEAVFGYNPTIKPLKIVVAKRRDANLPGGKTNVAKINGVQVGQQYVKVHSTRNPPPVWEVNSIHPGDFGIAHAGLKNLDDPLDRKTVSFSALLDKTHYRLLRDVGADPVEQDTSRGAMQTKGEPMLPSSKLASVFSGLLRRRATAR